MVVAGLTNLLFLIVVLIPSGEQRYAAIDSIVSILLMVWNVIYLILVLMNPGLPPRHVNAHTKSYLNRVKTIE